MSESAQFSDTTTRCQLEPPRSLQDVEDAGAIWNTITRRFPNAAPLLCEMETVIERAEDLLQQFKTPCTQGIDTSSSFHTPDSCESNATISISDIESFVEETNIVEHSENAEKQLTIHDINEKQTDLKSHHSEQLIQSEKKYPDNYLNSSPASLNSVVHHLKTRSINKCHNPQTELNVTNNDNKEIDVDSEKNLEKTIAEKNSLERWTKVADNALRGLHKDRQHFHMSNHSNAETQPSIGRNINNDLLIIDNNEKCGKVDHKCHENYDTKAEKNHLQTLQNNIESSSSANYRLPLTILEEYVNRCKVSIKYEYKAKQNRCEIVAELCGFRAMSCAETENLAKNELAAKILWLIAEYQMNKSKLSLSTCGLSDLSREEMLEIITFNKDKLKNASEKLYKFCLEKGVSIPEYSIRKSETKEGFAYIAQCVALGCIGTGKGSRKDGAKITAAEDLHRKYNKMEAQTI